MLLPVLRATVRLHFELFKLTPTNYFETLSSSLSEFHLAYLRKRTLSEDNSLPEKVGTGLGLPLASDQGKALRLEKQVNCEVEISTGPGNRGSMSIHLTSGTLPSKLRSARLVGNLIRTKLTTLAISEKRLEDSLNVKHQPQNAIPVNHNEVEKLNNP